MSRPRLLAVTASLLLAHGLDAHASGFLDLWLTPDQQGQRLLDAGDYAAAAETFVDADRRAMAFYRGGDFESAAALWGALRGADAAYNRGNALVLLGRYEEAVSSYDLALEQRAGWQLALENREIARLRLERLQPAEDDAGGTGGQLGADEIRYDDSGRVNESGSEEQVDGQKPLSDEAMRSAWLRRVQTNPADFLRARFFYQSARDAAGEVDE